MEAIEILAALSTPAGLADPYPLYARLHEIGEVIQTGPGNVLVIGYEAINSVLRDPGFLAYDEVLFDRHFPSWRESARLRASGGLDLERERAVALGGSGA